jgi:tetratricopeptide (TPR) repeat protein
MASGRAPNKLSQLWQGPLLVASLGLFGYSAWRFIDPKGVSDGDRVQVARDLLGKERPEAALDYLNQVVAEGKLEKKGEAEVRLLMAESIRRVQKQKHISIAVNHERIVTQVQVALAMGARPTADVHQMLGESYDALGRPADALASFRLAMGLDQGRSLGLQKKVIELQIESGDAGAEGTLAEYLASKEISESERAWALGERAQIMINRGDYGGAKALLKDALKPELDPVALGLLNYQLGYCAYTTGDGAEAERRLRLAREQLRVQHPLDADAAYHLGKIHEGRGEAGQAKSFYQVVLVSHPDAKVVPLALLGRGMCRLTLGENEAGLNDLHDLVGQINTRQSRSKYRDDVIEGLKRASSILSANGQYQYSLEAMAYEQELRGEPEGEFFARLGTVYEKRAEQVEREGGVQGDEGEWLQAAGGGGRRESADKAGQVKRQQQVRALRSKAGDAYVAYSKALRLQDDQGYGESLWRGIDLYDRAGDLPRAMAALELFVAERPADPLTPDALLRLGQAYRAAGLFDRAVQTFVQNQLRYPRSLAATKSLVPLAQAYIAKGPELYAKAEEVLLSVVENNPLLTPDAEEFRQGLFELAQLYYRTQRYEEAVSRLDEWTRRYPKDERLAQLAFWMADSYRKSAALLEGKGSGVRVPGSGAQAAANVNGSLADPAEVKGAKVERLTKARNFYDQVIELCKVTPPEGEIARLQLKLAHFYRADCMYDLGEYVDAIRLYDAAALRYQDDPSALSAYVQIVNAYCAMGKREEAKAANERVKWLLRKMPAESFAEGQGGMQKDHWDQWLKWASASGMW